MQPPLEYLQGNITVEATYRCSQGYWVACSVHLLHGEVPDIAAQLSAAGGAAGEFGPAVGADQVAGVALGGRHGGRRGNEAGVEVLGHEAFLTWRIGGST